MNQLKQRGIWEIVYLIWMAVIPVSTSIILGTIGFQEALEIKNWGTSALLLFWGSSIFVLGLGFFPTTFFALFCGYIWGFKAVVPIFFTYILASLLGYFVAKLIKGEKILGFLASKNGLNKILKNVNQNSIHWVFLIRLSPVFPFAITTALLAYLKVNLKSFVLGGALGMLPRSMFAIWAGSQAATWQKLLENPEKISAQNIFTLALFLLSGFGMFLLIRKETLTQWNQ